MITALRQFNQRREQRQAEQNLDAAARWNKIVETMAGAPDGAKMSAALRAEIDAVLDETGRSPADLESAVANKRRRQEWAEALAKAPARRLEIAEMEAEQARLVKEKDAFVKEIEHRSLQLAFRITEAHTALSTDVAAAERGLLASAPPELSKRIGEVNRSIGRLRGPLENAKDQRDHWAENLQRVEHAISEKRNDSTLPDKLENAKRVLAQRQAVLDEVQGKVDALNREREELGRLRLAP